MALQTWTVLAGLPGNGPIPIHYHLGNPTPWSEGLVVRFTPERHGEWVGNFQLGTGGGTDVLDWPEADGLVVLAAGNLYLLSKSEPENYVTLHSTKQVVLDSDREILLILAEPKVYGFGTNREMVWCSESLAHQIEFNSCRDGVVTFELQDDLEDPWRTVRLSIKTGIAL